MPLHVLLTAVANQVNRIARTTVGQRSAEQYWAYRHRG